MELDLFDILSEKEEGTRLYSPICGDLLLHNVSLNGVFCKQPGVKTEKNFVFMSDGHLKNYGEWADRGECLLFPNKEMRDWEKFAWKKGDVLMADVDNICIFDKWNNDEYTEFDAAFVTPDYRSDVLKTKYWHKVIGEKVIKRYISKIERNNGGKLNLTTLELEKTQPEFKDGDIITFKDRIIIIYNTSIEKSPKRTEIYYHACLKEGELTVNEYLMSCGFGEGWYSSTEEEKHNLFEALAKKGKAWDSKKKKVVNLKPKFDELKPFDKVVVRCSEADRWSIDFFSYKVHNGYICTGDAWFGYCLPYNDETAHLLGTTDDWKGGDG